ncbi:MAG: SAM-dependent methyltransferase, partial [Chloroflexota bacterium]|nr:SAM-dependent methyltransferase [Chloroflexota bacterium]
MVSLESLIKDRIRREGPIPFARFMEMALYTPSLGYYTSGKERVGPQGDFYTSPAVHPAFGALIALALEGMWRFLDCPTPFTVVEMGAGKGHLARDVLAFSRHLTPGLASALKYVTVDHGESLPSGVVGCILSNELLDAFPVHRVVVQDGQLKEIYVGISPASERAGTTKDDNVIPAPEPESRVKGPASGSGTLDSRFRGNDKVGIFARTPDPSGDFIEVTGPPSTPLLAQRLEEEGIALVEGQQGEISLGLEPWVRGVAAALERGYVLTVDYGHEAPELYAPRRPRGTFLCYWRHMTSENPYLQVGERDMTAHVDFTALLRASEKAGLRRCGLVSQREFLEG